MGRKIPDAIDNCDTMVIVFSGSCDKSKEVDREIEIAAKGSKNIIPFKVSDVEYHGVKKYYLENLNWVAAFSKPEDSFDDLLSAINGFVTNQEGQKKRLRGRF